MLHRIAIKAATLVLKNEQDGEADKEQYIYGFEVILGKTLTYIILFVIGSVLNLFFEMLVFISFVIFLRGQTGGYHLNNSFGCIFCTTAISIFSILLANNIKYQFAISVLPVLVFISILVICIYSPINHPNLLLNKQEARRCAKCSMLFTGIELLIVTLLILFRAKESIIISACLGIVVVAILMIVAKIIKQEVPYYE